MRAPVRVWRRRGRQLRQAHHAWRAAPRQRPSHRMSSASAASCWPSPRPAWPSPFAGSPEGCLGEGAEPKSMVRRQEWGCSGSTAGGIAAGGGIAAPCPPAEPPSLRSLPLPHSPTLPPTHQPHHPLACRCCAGLFAAAAPQPCAASSGGTLTLVLALTTGCSGCSCPAQSSCSSSASTIGSRFRLTGPCDLFSPLFGCSSNPILRAAAYSAVSYPVAMMR